MIENRELMLDTIASEIASGEAQFDGREVASWLSGEDPSEVRGFFRDLESRLRRDGVKDAGEVAAKWAAPSERMLPREQTYDILSRVTADKPNSRVLQSDSESAAVLRRTSQGLFVALVDRLQGTALMVDLATKECSALITKDGVAGLKEEARRTPYLDHVGLSATTRDYLSRELADISACLGRTHQMTPDGDFIVTRDTEGRYNLAANFAIDGKYGRMIMERGLTDRPRLFGSHIEGTSGNTMLKIRRTDDDRVEIRRRLNVETRIAARKLMTPLNLQSANHDHEAVSQRAAYVESIGGRRTPEMEKSVGKMKKVLHEELFEIRYREASNEETAARTQKEERRSSRHR